MHSIYAHRHTHAHRHTGTHIRTQRDAAVCGRQDVAGRTLLQLELAHL